MFTISASSASIASFCDASQAVICASVLMRCLLVGGDLHRKARFAKGPGLWRGGLEGQRPSNLLPYTAGQRCAQG
ncbi:hypothetical protein GCM10011320_49360 [Neoroseomonas lacus]|uniref:Uncharacterized protein n=1 Tax=Neoroseomonas lacus TaxID=287609 RepID=A0A917NWL6_9PROT|nr:hypothetical protein GCM10011320_49360 [Neoroseomonas lacus]